MLSKFSVKKPYTVFVGVVLVIILGIVSFTKMVTPVFEQLHLDTSLVDKIVGEGSAFVKEFGTFFSEAIPALISTSYGVIKTLLNVLIGMAAAMYMLLDKEYFITMITKFNFAVFPENVASYLSSLTTVIKNVFYDYILTNISNM